MPVSECFHGISIEVHAVRESGLLTLQLAGNVPSALCKVLNVLIENDLREGPVHLEEGVRCHLAHHTGLDKKIMGDSYRIVQKFRVRRDVDPDVKLREALSEA